MTIKECEGCRHCKPGVWCGRFPINDPRYFIPYAYCEKHNKRVSHENLVTKTITWRIK